MPPETVELSDLNHSQSVATTAVSQVVALEHVSGQLEAGAEGVIWARQVPDHIECWLLRIAAGSLPHGRLILHPQDVEERMRRLFEDAGISHSSELDWLCADAEKLAMFVRDLADTPFVQLRLEAVADNACRKFHVDNVLARLICTYRGPGTQISESPDSVAATRTVTTGDPIILKGRLWPGAHQPRLFHRSPPIEGTDTIRLVLVLEGSSLDPNTVNQDSSYGT